MVNNPKGNKYSYIEAMLIIGLCLVSLVVSLLINRTGKVFQWDKIIVTWIKVFSFFLIFLLNLYLFIPRFLENKNYEKYILYLLVVVPLIICLQTKIIAYYQTASPTGMPPMELGPGMPPMELSDQMPAPHGFKLPETTKLKSADAQFLINFMIALLVIGIGTAYKVICFWSEEAKEKRQLEDLMRANNEKVNKYIFIRADLRMVKILITDIVYVESANEYVKIVLLDGSNYLTFMRLKNIEKELPEDSFMRVQRSFIVNLDRIRSVEKNRILVDDAQYIPIGNQYKEKFQEYLGKNFIS